MALIFCRITRWYLDIEPLGKDVASTTTLRAHGLADNGHPCQFTFIREKEASTHVEGRLQTKDVISPAPLHAQGLKRVLNYRKKDGQPFGMFEYFPKSEGGDAFYHFDLPTSQGVIDFLIYRMPHTQVVTQLSINVDSGYEEAIRHHSYAMIDTWGIWQLTEPNAETK